MSRLNILSANEQKEFDSPPMLNHEGKSICFSLTDRLQKKINQIRIPTNKVGFLLQYAYFKASKKFYAPRQYYKKDIYHAAKLLGISIDDVDLNSYSSSSISHHRKIIIDFLNHHALTTEHVSQIKKNITYKVQCITNPRALFFEILHTLHDKNIEIPTYHFLSELITSSYNKQEDIFLLKVHNNLTEQQKASLNSLIETSKKNSVTKINSFRYMNQSSKPKAIQASVALFLELNEITHPIFPLITKLSLTPQSCEYHATWVKKAKLSQLLKIKNKSKLYFYLTTFLQDQYYKRQDLFVDMLIKCVQSFKNIAKSSLQEADPVSKTERRNAVRHITKKIRDYESLVDEITTIIKTEAYSDTIKVEKVNSLLEENEKLKNAKEQKKLELFEKSLDAMVNDKDYFNVLEKGYIKLKNRVSDILKVLVFNTENSDKKLIQAIEYYKTNSILKKENIPIDFLSEIEKEAIFDEKSQLRSALYKVLLYFHIADSIKSGKLNLKYSYRYLAIQQYLINKTNWDSEKKALIKAAGLEVFSDCDEIIQNLKAKLDEKYHTVNKHYLDGLNPYLSKNEDHDRRFNIATPALDEKEKKHISALLGQVKYVPILKVLSDIDEICSFTKKLKHHSIKNVKLQPKVEVFLAGIIGLGCNIGIAKMAQISLGINQNTMYNTVNWYFTIKTLNAANQSIRDFINRLSLPNMFKHDTEILHGSSDGQKYGVNVDCILANYSFKYFGKDKGISVYSFIDERQVLFHHNVLSASEREAAYVIDGLLDQYTPKIDIHSTDTHGYTELVFAVTHLIETSFAPRIKKLWKQNIYSFSTKKLYEKLGYVILPSRTININLIKRHWDDILRFMATIKLKRISASLLFKRLSSYAKDNPLYQALKEFGRIVKSIFILTYYDDVKLRQRIERQLNRIESSNKFSKAIFYADNREFKKSDPDEQNLAVACKVLIQNSIVLWNYLYLSQIITNCKDEEEQKEALSMIKDGSILCWGHINLHGEFNFKNVASNDHSFNLDKILNLKVN